MPTLIATPLPSAGRDAENETREKLIVAAENLFALHGYQGVSVRAIAAAAGVNWSLLGYYFRGKEGLLFEVYRRHCNALNAERFQLLEATRAECQPPQLEKVIEAFVLPALSIAQTQASGVSFSRPRSVLAADDSKLLDRSQRHPISLGRAPDRRIHGQPRFAALQPRPRRQGNQVRRSLPASQPEGS